MNYDSEYLTGNSYSKGFSILVRLAFIVAAAGAGCNLLTPAVADEPAIHAIKHGHGANDARMAVPGHRCQGIRTVGP